MSLDDHTILSLIDLTDRVGVLSFYVGITPEGLASPQPPWEIEIRNRVRELRQRCREELDRPAWQAVEQALEDLQSELTELTDAKASGRGRALFVAVENGHRERLSLQVPFRQRVVLADTAFVRPLVAAQDEGRPAGVAVAYQEGLRVLEWRLGEAEELRHERFNVEEAHLAGQKQGPSADNPAMAQAGVTHRDRFEQRLDENRLRFLRSAAGRLGTEVRRRGWDRLVVAGEPRVRQAVLDGLQLDESVRILEGDHQWETDPPHRVAEEAWPTLRSVHRAREQSLVEQARDQALAGGPGALGLQDTLGCLNEGRVDHLLFASDLEVTGYRVPEAGLLYADAGEAETASGGTAVKEPLLVERMIERALQTDARITPVDDEPAEMLREHGGVGAVLRW